MKEKNKKNIYDLKREERNTKIKQAEREAQSILKNLFNEPYRKLSQFYLSCKNKKFIKENALTAFSNLENFLSKNSFFNLYCIYNHPSGWRPADLISALEKYKDSTKLNVDEAEKLVFVLMKECLSHQAVSKTLKPKHDELLLELEKQLSNQFLGSIFKKSFVNLSESFLEHIDQIEKELPKEVKIKKPLNPRRILNVNTEEVVLRDKLKNEALIIRRHLNELKEEILKRGLDSSINGILSVCFKKLDKINKTLNNKPISDGQIQINLLQSLIQKLDTQYLKYCEQLQDEFKVGLQRLLEIEQFFKSTNHSYVSQKTILNWNKELDAFKNISVEKVGLPDILRMKRCEYEGHLIEEGIYQKQLEEIKEDLLEGLKKEKSYLQLEKKRDALKKDLEKLNKQFQPKIDRLKIEKSQIHTQLQAYRNQLNIKESNRLSKAEAVLSREIAKLKAKQKETLQGTQDKWAAINDFLLDLEFLPLTSLEASLNRLVGSTSLDVNRGFGFRKKTTSREKVEAFEKVAFKTIQKTLEDSKDLLEQEASIKQRRTLYKEGFCLEIKKHIESLKKKTHDELLSKELQSLNPHDALEPDGLNWLENLEAIRYQVLGVSVKKTLKKLSSEPHQLQKDAKKAQVFSNNPFDEGENNKTIHFIQKGGKQIINKRENLVNQVVGKGKIEKNFEKIKEELSSTIEDVITFPGKVIEDITQLLKPKKNVSFPISSEASNINGKHEFSDFENRLKSKKLYEEETQLIFSNMAVIYEKVEQCIFSQDINNPGFLSTVSSANDAFYKRQVKMASIEKERGDILKNYKAVERQVEYFYDLKQNQPKLITEMILSSIEARILQLKEAGVREINLENILEFSFYNHFFFNKNTGVQSIKDAMEAFKSAGDDPQNLFKLRFFSVKRPSIPSLGMTCFNKSLASEFVNQNPALFENRETFKAQKFFQIS